MGINKKDLVRKLGAEGMVLLQNDGTLPLKKDSKIALFGRTGYFCFKGGAGSGDVMGREPVQPFDAITAQGVCIDHNVADIYKKFNASRYEAELKYWNRYNREWKNSFEEPEIPKEVIEESAQKCEIAVVSLGRSSGEWLDIPREKGAYYLTDTEISLLENITKHFKKTVLLLNFCGICDISFTKKFDFNAVVYTAMGGEEMGNSVCDVLFGKVNPSGKLTDTWGNLEDYPTHTGFQDLYIPYNEGIYVGYRYFDTFGIDPIFPFGYGLSYTDFDITHDFTEVNETEVTVAVSVKNTGNFAGREVVQVYLSEPSGKLDKAYQQLAAFKKTKELAPNETQQLKLSFKLTDFAAYCEKCASYILEKGEYFVRVGNSSRNTAIIAALTLEKDVVCEKLSNRLSPKKPLDLIKPDPSLHYTYPTEKEEKENCERIPIDTDKIVCKEHTYEYTPDNTVHDGKLHTFGEVANGKITMQQFVAQLNETELANILNGVTGSSLPTEMHVGTMARKIEGGAGEIWSDAHYDLPACVNADGPAGIRLGGFIDTEGQIPRDTELSLKMTAFPTATTLANSWDEDNLEQFGRAVSEDMQYCGLDGWLAPGMNIHRNPLCGRNFEYYSEDPLISGFMAAATVRGIQTDENGNSSRHYATIKHFAANNAEKYRFDSDSAVSERALREIYLKGFKIAIDRSQPLALMNSYNMINGEFASDSYDLNTAILRFEWGFDGCVMTDWGAHSHALSMPNAGCDLVMPGCKNKEYLEGIENGKIPLSVARRCAANVLTLVLKTAYKNDNK